MILFRTEACRVEPGGFCRARFLAALLKPGHSVQVSENRDRPPRSKPPPDGETPLDTRRLERFAEEGLACVVFDLERFSPEDNRLITWCRENKIATVCFAGPLAIPKPVDYVIDCDPAAPGRYPSGQKGLFGTEFAVLHHRFRHFHMISRRYRTKIDRIIWILGPGIPYRLTRRLVDVLLRYGFKVKIHPATFLKRAHLKGLKRRYPNLRITGKPETLARPLFEADLALLSPGSHLFEAAACGTPAIMLVSNGKEGEIARSFSKHRLGSLSSPGWEKDPGVLVQQIRDFEADSFSEMGRCGKEKVDGRGAYRVRDFIADLHA